VPRTTNKQQKKNQQPKVGFHGCVYDANVGKRFRKLNRQDQCRDQWFKDGYVLQYEHLRDDSMTWGAEETVWSPQHQAQFDRTSGQLIPMDESELIYHPHFGWLTPAECDKADDGFDPYYTLSWSTETDRYSACKFQPARAQEPPKATPHEPRSTSPRVNKQTFESNPRKRVRRRRSRVRSIETQSHQPWTTLPRHLTDPSCAPR
jgi:hypothetical protein